MDEDREYTLAVLDALFGDGYWEVAKAMTREEKDEIGRKIGLATNTAGMIAGPAAIAMAVGQRKQGGMFRTAARSAGERAGIKPAEQPKKIPKQMKEGTTRYKLARKAGKAAKWLDAPGNSTKAKIAAGGLGATMIALQGANWAGDTIAAKTLKKKPEETVKKSEDKEIPKVKLVMVKVAADQGAKAVKKAPVAAKKTKETAKRVPGAVRYATKGTVEKSVNWEVRGEISKMDTEKKQVFGWASVIEKDGVPVIDLQGDIMTIETIEKAAYEYVNKSRKGGHQHRRDGSEPVHVSDMIESFVITPEKKEKMGLPDSTPTGWWVGFQVNDDDTWQAYKDGRLKEFSIHGSGTRKALEI